MNGPFSRVFILLGIRDGKVHIFREPRSLTFTCLKYEPRSLTIMNFLGSIYVSQVHSRSVHDHKPIVGNRYFFMKVGNSKDILDFFWPPVKCLLLRSIFSNWKSSKKLNFCVKIGSFSLICVNLNELKNELNWAKNMSHNHSRSWT